MDTYSYDYLHGTDIYLFQRKDMFRINTDTALLAEFMVIKKDERVLDIGTNNGALLLAAARYKPSRMYGIDIQQEAIALANYNMQHHHLHNVELISGDVRTTPLEKVDVIVCNPPYFKVDENSHLNESEALRMARHETYLKLADLCNRISCLLDEKGRCYMVHRANRIAEIISLCCTYRLAIRTLQFVYDQQKDEAVSVLIEMVKDGKVNTHVRLPIYLDRTS